MDFKANCKLIILIGVLCFVTAFRYLPGNIYLFVATIFFNIVISIALYYMFYYLGSSGVEKAQKEQRALKSSLFTNILTHLIVWLT